MESELKNLITACVTVLLIVMSLASCHHANTKSEHEAIVDLVRAGSTPTEAKCAITPSANDAALCALAAANHHAPEAK